MLVTGETVHELDLRGGISTTFGEAFNQSMEQVTLPSWPELDLRKDILQPQHGAGDVAK